MKLNWISKIVTIAMLTVSVAAVSFAQTAGPAGGQLAAKTPAAKAKHKNPLVTALGKLSLSKEQNVKVKALLKARRQDNKAFLTANPGADVVDKAGVKAHKQAENEKLMTGLKGVLTSAQWDSLQADLKANKKTKKPKALKPAKN